MNSLKAQFKRMMNELTEGNIFEYKYFKDIYPTIIEDNRKRLVVLTAVVFVGMVIMLGSSYLFDSLVKNRSIYCIMGCISGLLCFASARLKNSTAVLVVMYSFIGLLFVFGILLGTVIEPNETSVSFPVLLFAVPLMFSDHPHRMNASVIVGIIVYCFAAKATQSELMLQYNLTNVIPYGAFSILICSIMMRVKLSRYILQYRYSAINRELEDTNRLLEEARIAADASNNAKSYFLFNMSHDIRTPMNAILGFTNLLKNKLDDTETALSYIKKIEESGEYLLSIINNVLDMARIESGEMKIDENVADIGEPDSYLFKMFAADMEKKNITVTHDLRLNHRYVWTDETLIAQLFANLISNAIKYTPAGGHIHHELIEYPCDREGYGKYVTKIRDTGIGMSEEFMQHIFDPFTREHTTTESSIPGTGLGMSIVKKIVDLLDGSIEVESELGKGTTFTVTLQYRYADAMEVHLDKETETNECSDFTGKRILLAEDNALNAEIAMEILMETGAEVEHAADGVICVDMVAKSDPGYYDLILMDVQMPNLDGYMATRKIRLLEDPVKAEIPIIAMTANAFEEDKKDALEAGMNDHLAKPIQIDKLYEMMRKYL